MYQFLLTVNVVFFIYVFAVFIAPRKTLFFIKDKLKRKRVPYSLIVLACYIGWFALMSPVIEKTPERKLERIEEADSIALSKWDTDDDAYGERLNTNETELNEYLKGIWVSEDGNQTITFKPLPRAIPYDYRPEKSSNIPHMIRVTMKVKIEREGKTKPYYVALHNEGAKHLRLFSNINKEKGDCEESFLFVQINYDEIDLQNETTGIAIKFHRTNKR